MLRFARRYLRVLAGRQGISLIEIMVAIGLGTIVSLGVLQLLSEGFRSSNNMMTGTAASAQRRLLSDFLSSRMPSASLPLREAYSRDDTADASAIDKFVFRVNWDGKPEFWTIWVDCDAENTEGARPTIRSSARERAYSTSYPPSLGKPPPPPDGGNPIVRVRDCEEGMFEYFDSAGRKITRIADRLSQTRMIKIRVRPPKEARSSDYTLRIPVGINAAPAELTPIPNGDFEAPSAGTSGALDLPGIPHTFDDWSKDDSALVRVVAGDGFGVNSDSIGVSELQGARVLKGSDQASGGILSAPFVSFGDPLSVRVRDDGKNATGADVNGQEAANCRVQVISADADYTVLRDISAGDSSADPSGWRTVTVVMSGDAGQERRIRLANTGPGGCTFDQIQSNG